MLLNVLGADNRRRWLDRLYPFITRRVRGRLRRRRCNDYWSWCFNRNKLLNIREGDRTDAAYILNIFDGRERAVLGALINDSI